MSAYESMVSEHWVAGLPNLPDAARGYFACFALIRNAWDSCVNGAWLLRLALELAPDDLGREEVKRVASDVLREMATQLDRHFIERKIKDDPIKLAYDDAKTEIHLAIAPIDKPMPESVVNDADQPVYERSIRILRRFTSDLVRARLSTPIGLRPDPAFEDTKAIPAAMLPELTRMKAEMEAAAAATSGQGLQPTPSAPATVPSTQPQSQAPGVPRPAPRPTNPGTGGVRSR